MQEGKYNPNGKGEKLLTELGKKRLTLLEFQRECAKWLLEPECWNTFHPKKFPIKSDKILEHEAMPLSHRKDLSKKYFDDNPEILIHYSKEMAVLYYNEQRSKDLSELIDSIDNSEQYEKLKTKKAEFDNLIVQQGSQLGIKRYIYAHPEYQRVAKEFSGE